MRRWGRRPALGLKGEGGSYWFSYRETSQAIAVAAEKIASYQFPPGARILIWAPNTPEWVVCFLAITLSGLVVVAVDSNQDTAVVVDAIARTGAVLLVYGSGQQAPDFGGQSISILEVIGEPIDTSPTWTPAALHPESPATILFTTGSSGEPQGVVLSHGNLMAQLSGFRGLCLPFRILHFRMLALTPLSHILGLLMGSLFPLSVGLSVLYVRSIDPGSLMTTIRLGRISILLAVPGVLALLEEKLRDELKTRYRLEPLSSWKLPLMFGTRMTMGPLFRVIMTGSAILPPRQERFWGRLGTVLIQGYGATETTGIAAINWPWNGRFGSVGKARNGGAIRVAEDGEVQVRGPQIAAGYFTSVKPMELTEDGYYRTGDLGRFDRRKRLYLTGRIKDLIVTSEGNNVSPTRLEAALATVSGVRDSVVCPLQTESGETTHAVLLLANGADAAACVRQANRILPDGHRIESWSVWTGTDFPRGVSGKIRRQEVVLAIQHGSPAAMGRGATLEQCLAERDASRRVEQLCRYFVEKGDLRRFIEIAVELRDFGLDSIQVIQLGARLEALRGSPGTFVEQTHLSTAAPSSRAVRLRPEKEKPPRRQYWPIFRVARSVIRLVTVDLALAFKARVRRDGMHNLRDVPNGCIFALSAGDRRDALDYLHVYRALPRRLGRRLFLLMRSNPPDGFAPYLHDDASVSLLRRWCLAMLFRLGLPAVFPFSLFPASTTRSTALGLAHAGTAIERGFCPLSVWGPGVALLAAESRCAVIPVRLCRISAQRPSRKWPVTTVCFGAPLRISARAEYRDVAADIEHRFTAMNC